MDFQSFFYIVASLFMLGWLVFLIGLMVGVMLLFRRLSKLSETFEEKIANPMTSMSAMIAPMMAILLPLIQYWRSGKRS
jgi:hypothetical protein